MEKRVGATAGQHGSGRRLSPSHASDRHSQREGTPEFDVDAPIHVFEWRLGEYTPTAWSAKAVIAELNPDG